MSKFVKLAVSLAILFSSYVHGEGTSKSQQSSPLNLIEPLFLQPENSRKQAIKLAEQSEKATPDISGISPHTALQWQAVQINQMIFDEKTLIVGNQILVPLFDLEITVTITKITKDINDVMSIVGKIDNEQFGLAYLTIQDQDLFAYFELPKSGREFQLSSSKLISEDAFILQEIDLTEKDVLPSAHPEHQHEMAVTPEPLGRLKPSREPSSSDSLRQSENSAESESEDAQIDVLVVYTGNAVRRLQSEGLDINSAIAIAIERANTAMSNSGIQATVQLVASKGIDYLEQGSCAQLLSDATSSANGLEPLAAWRQESKADIVSFFVNIDNDCGGLANLLYHHPEDWPYARSPNIDQWRAERGFNVVRIAQAHNTYTFAHELGHNLGANHHPDQLSLPGEPGESGPTSWRLYDYEAKEWYTDPNRIYSAGWRWSDPVEAEPCCVTIMSYDQGRFYDDGETRVMVPYFSSPDIFRGQFPTGDFVYADNARTLNETASFVSKYDLILGLDGKSRLPPTLIQGGLSGSWYDPERNGEGFLLEFAENGSGKMATAYWFTYYEGQPYWLFGATPYVVDDGEIRFDLSQATGPDFGADFDSSQLSIESWGEVTFKFISCSRAVAEWRSLDGEQGSFDLQRITSSLADSTCL